jgi:SnoaL-like domain
VRTSIGVRTVTRKRDRESMGLTIDDRLAIQDLAARYSHAVDNGDAEGFGATFVETGVLDAGRVQLEGHSELKEFALNFARSRRAPRHVASNLVIDGDGDTATLKAYVQMFVLTGEPPQQTVSVSGTYDDVLTKKDGSWKFVRRTFTSDF